MTTFNTQHVLQWRLQLEEFKPIFLYKTGKSNVIADALSRIPTKIHTHSHTVIWQLPANAHSRASQLPAKDHELVQQFPADLDTYITLNTSLPKNSIIDTTPDLTECLLEHQFLMLMAIFTFNFQPSTNINNTTKQLPT